ncbi:MAG TPA: helix-turn-helix domain-containing protein [Jatrophihabitantaceae bacterium]|nr:helix-turn-helix domain-containing protein [Jatrophihabitantaceae bacterium]
MSTRESAVKGRRRRRYESPRRAEQAGQTRAVILGAARGLFGERGWAATGMRDVAGGAGVAVETVYASFGSKADLLLAALDVGVVGDELPIPLADRAEFAALGRGTRAQRARAAARLVRGINERTYGTQKALREAAASDAELSKRLREADERRRINVADGARLVAGRPVSETERDGVWAVLSMDVYELLVERSGWSAARYERWLADTIVRLLRRGKETT